MPTSLEARIETVERRVKLLAVLLITFASAWVIPVLTTGLPYRDRNGTVPEVKHPARITLRVD